MATILPGPAWDNTSVYESLESPRVAADLERVRSGTREMEELSAKLRPVLPGARELGGELAAAMVAICQEISERLLAIRSVLWDLRTYAHCELCVDGRNAAAKVTLAQIEELWARLQRAIKPRDQFLVLVSDDVMADYLRAEHTAPEEFRVRYERTRREAQLPLEIEDLVISLSVNGHKAWGQLYDNISGTLTCRVDHPETPEPLGIASASSRLEDAREEMRRAAYQAVNEAWEGEAETCASILNAIAGWRHEIDRRRSRTREEHFLSESLFDGRLTRQTLDALFTAVRDRRGLAQEGMKLQARALGKQALEPWDRVAPPPPVGDHVSSRFRFEEAIDLVARSFDSVSKEMGDLARTMAAERWIEGRVLDTKRPGGFCTQFVGSRTPRVYMTYTGGMREVSTLAHEIGHAFHSWVMRDLPLVQTQYPMTLAETASIFAETVVSESLESRAAGDAELLDVLWTEARRVEALLLNVPARYTFEQAFYEERRERSFTVEDFKKLMVEHWEHWYGDSLTAMDPMFWASKLHFHLTSVRFYNFPYTFGFLFALGVYGLRERHGDAFIDRYVALLRDSGRMTVEELARKHLDADLTRPEFWNRSLDVVETKIARFGEVVGRLFPPA